MLPVVTGVDSLGFTDELQRIAERQVTLKRLFNAREGISRKDDRLPSRFTDEPVPEGPGRGQRVNLEPMLNDHYRLRGWNLENGLPTDDTLRGLSLKWTRTSFPRK